MVIFPVLAGAEIQKRNKTIEVPPDQHLILFLSVNVHEYSDMFCSVASSMNKMKTHEEFSDIKDSG